MIAQTAIASGLEETFLVMQTNSGELIQLEYSSEGEDERVGIRRYASRGSDNKSKTTKCSYKDGESPRRLACTYVDGKRVSRLFEEAQNSTSRALQMYKRYVGNRLPSSVGELHEVILVCVSGCPAGQPSVAIWITCAECGMEEEWCRNRYKSQPKSAVVASDELNLRTAPNLKGELSGKARLDQVLHLTEVRSACSEIQTKDGVRVGRWIFDPYVRYENEK